MIGTHDHDPGSSIYVPSVTFGPSAVRTDVRVGCARSLLHVGGVLDERPRIDVLQPRRQRWNPITTPRMAR